MRPAAKCIWPPTATYRNGSCNKHQTTFDGTAENIPHFTVAYLRGNPHSSRDTPHLRERSTRRRSTGTPAYRPGLPSEHKYDSRVSTRRKAANSGIGPHQTRDRTVADSTALNTPLKVVLFADSLLRRRRRMLLSGICCSAPPPDRALSTGRAHELSSPAMQHANSPPYTLGD